MARLEDMHVDIEVVQGSDAVRIALVRSAAELVASFSNRPPAITSELKAYEAALEFLQMQYELERPCVHIKTDERAPTTRPAQAE